MTIVFVDTETSGMDPTQHDVIQVAAIAVTDDLQSELGRLNLLVKFDIERAEPAALERNCYDADRWSEAVSRIKAVEEFSSFLEQHRTVQMTSKRTGRPYSVARLAGHSVASFDMPFLRAMFRTNFFPAHPIPLDTMHLAAWWNQTREVHSRQESINLEALCQTFAVRLTKAHDAMHDVEATLAVARSLLYHMRSSR